MATVNAVELPTEAEYKALEHQVMKARDAVEKLGARMGHVYEDRPPTRPATLADVGALWSFIDALRGLAKDMLDEADRLTKGLQGLGLQGLDNCRWEGWVATVDEAS